MHGFLRDVASAKTYVDLEKVIHKVIGVSGFMEFIRFNLGGSCGRNVEKKRHKVCVS